MSKRLLYSFAKWVIHVILYIPEFFLRSFYTLVHRNKKIKKGVNLIGFPKGNFGLAEHIRLVAHSMKTTPVEFCVNDVGKSEEGGFSNNELNSFIKKDTLYQINLFCFNTEYTLAYMKSFRGGVALRKHYNIGYGYWELSKYPSEWTKQNKYLDEIWAPSLFIKKVLEQSTERPVYYMPIPVDFIDPVGYTRQGFKLPENAFLFLFTFDISSSVVRKNPQAVIQAFIQAFPKEMKDNVCLVIKINRIKNNSEHTQKVKELRMRVSFDNRIIVVDEVLDRPSILGLISVCDAYVSLHRSEGFGLGMAEAMKMGKVVIATDYSGNKDFMNEENSCPVKYKLISVNKEEFSNVEDGAEWAEPDINHASYYMKKAYQDRGFVNRIGQAAKIYISENHSFKIVGENYRKRLTEILNK